MSAEALLENPGLFNDARVTSSKSGAVASWYDFDYRSRRIDIRAEEVPLTHGLKEPPVCSAVSAPMTPTAFCLEYLEICKSFPPSDFYKCIKAHALKLLHRPLALAGRGSEREGSASCSPSECRDKKSARTTSRDDVTTSSSRGAQARDAVMAAQDESQLVAAVKLLDAFMAVRAAALPPEGTICSTCGGAMGREGKDGTGQAPGDDTGGCECWRYDTWYRRHRPPSLKAGSAKDSSATAGTRSSRKDQRREKYRAMGYQGL